jgi:hypothetical protein
MNAFTISAEEAIIDYPKLKLVEKADHIIIKGEIELYQDAELLDTYQIEIHPSLKFPFRFPIVFETGGMIPINVDWHIYPTSENCCIKVLPEELLICKDGISISCFIKNELIPYFFNQTYRRENGFFINERSHGIKGLVEFYAEKFKTNDIKKIILILGHIAFKGEPDRVALCFCGSKEKYRRCHREAYKLLSQLKKEDLLSQLQIIIEYQKGLI